MYEIVLTKRTETEELIYNWVTESPVLRSKVSEWLDENIDFAFWDFEKRPLYEHNSVGLIALVFTFTFEEDAVAFKLRWL
jgi:hypothetical protein